MSRIKRIHERAFEALSPAEREAVRRAEALIFRQAPLMEQPIERVIETDPVFALLYRGDEVARLGLETYADTCRRALSVLGQALQRMAEAHHPTAVFEVLTTLQELRKHLVFAPYRFSIPTSPDRPPAVIEKRHTKWGGIEEIPVGPEQPSDAYLEKWAYSPIAAARARWMVREHPPVR